MARGRSAHYFGSQSLVFGRTPHPPRIAHHDGWHGSALQNVLRPVGATGVSFFMSMVHFSYRPIMRVHQMHGVPRFPWLWGGDEHQAAFRSALEARL